MLPTSSEGPENIVVDIISEPEDSFLFTAYSALAQS